MNHCAQCPRALDISACATELIIGTLVVPGADVVARITDQATGRTTVAQTDSARLPDIVVTGLPDLVPGHDLLVELVVISEDGSVLGPVAFYPWTAQGSGVEPADESVTCLQVTARRLFAPEGSFVAGATYLIVA